jgi:GNAT superfamily N-acetyltransferase
MAAAVASAYDKQGLATAVLRALTERALARGLDHVVAPLRPTWKHRYPTFAMADYATWQRHDGLSVDPWVRTHQRMGARILGPATRSMVITGTVAEWESWADMLFPVSGDFVIPDGLNLLHVDRARDVATYAEENLWVQHR